MAVGCQVSTHRADQAFITSVDDNIKNNKLYRSRHYTKTYTPPTPTPTPSPPGRPKQHHRFHTEHKKLRLLFCCHIQQKKKKTCRKFQFSHRDFFFVPLTSRVKLCERHDRFPQRVLSSCEKRPRLCAIMSNRERNKKILLELVKRPDNSRCADCRAPGKSDVVAVTLWDIYICIHIHSFDSMDIDLFYLWFRCYRCFLIFNSLIFMFHYSLLGYD